MRHGQVLAGMDGFEAVKHIKSGMRLGIGTGSTAEAFIHELAPKVADGLDIIGVPTSERTAQLCRELNIPLTTLEDSAILDLTIDGADEVDKDLNLIKAVAGHCYAKKLLRARRTKCL